MSKVSIGQTVKFRIGRGTFSGQIISINGAQVEVKRADDGKVFRRNVETLLPARGGK